MRVKMLGMAWTYTIAAMPRHEPAPAALPDLAALAPDQLLAALLPPEELAAQVALGTDPERLLRLGQREQRDRRRLDGAARDAGKHGRGRGRGAGHPRSAGPDGRRYENTDQDSRDVLSTARKASCGISTWPTCFIRFLPSACFAKSLRLRVISPP